MQNAVDSTVLLIDDDPNIKNVNGRVCAGSMSSLETNSNGYKSAKFINSVSKIDDRSKQNASLSNIPLLPHAYINGTNINQLDSKNRHSISVVQYRNESVTNRQRTTSSFSVESNSLTSSCSSSRKDSGQKPVEMTITNPIDMSHLSPEEKIKIEQVLERAKAEDNS